MIVVCPKCGEIRKARFKTFRHCGFQWNSEVHRYNPTSNIITKPIREVKPQESELTEPSELAEVNPQPLESQEQPQEVKSQKPSQTENSLEFKGHDFPLPKPESHEEDKEPICPNCGEPLAELEEPIEDEEGTIYTHVCERCRKAFEVEETALHPTFKAIW